MKRAVVYQLFGLLVASQHVEQGGFFEHEVITAFYQLRILLQEGQTLGVRLVQTLVELVEFHEHTLVVLVKVEGTLHILQSLRLTSLLVEATQGEVAPYGGEIRVKLGRTLPVLDGEVVLTGSIVETAQIVWSLGTTGI